MPVGWLIFHSIFVFAKIPKKFAFIILAFCLLLSSSCGKRRPPVPPARRAAINLLTADQQGNQVVLKITLPASQEAIKQISVYRLNELTDSPNFLSEDEFSSRATVIAVLNIQSNEAGQSVFFNDVLSTPMRSIRLRYAVRFVFEDGRRSAFSNFFLIEPNFRVSVQPNLLPALVRQDAIQLEWQKPEANIDQTKPANIIGYNVYRKIVDEKQEFQLINPRLLSETKFADQNFEFGINYQYFVRAVTVGSAGQPIESANSNVITVNPRDTFPPAAPQGLTIAAAPGRLSLFFAANNESDVVGYNIYRSTDEKIPIRQWQKLNQTLITATTYQDLSVESGQRYFYYLIAVDKAGNSSAPSEIVSEIAP